MQTGFSLWQASADSNQARKAKLGLSLLLTLEVWLAVALAMALLAVWSWRETAKVSAAQAEAYGRAVYELTLAGLTSLAMTGHADKRDLLLEQIRMGHEIESLNVIRSDAIIRQYGNRGPARPSTSELEVIQSKRAITTRLGAGNEERLQIIKPILASRNFLGKDCLACHQAREGDVLGVVSLELSMKRHNARQDLLAIESFAIASLFALAVAGFCYMRVSRRVMKPIANMRQGLERIAAGKASPLERLPVTGNDEISQAGKSFNRVMDRAIAEAEQNRLDTEVFNRALEGITITDQNGVIQKVNPAFSRMTGYTAAEAIGKTPAILKSGRQDPFFYEAMWKTLLTTGQWQGEIWNRRKNGEIYPEWLSISSVRGPDGMIEHFMAIFSDITESKLRESDMAHQATHDPLTGLANRALFMDRLEQAIAMSARLAHNHVGVIFLDLDGFKPVNDNFGHHEGDRVLQEVAVRLSSVVRHNDTVARLGGDEFTLLLPNLAHRDDAEIVARTILDCIEIPFNVMGNQVRLSASIGISCFPYDGLDAETLIKHADEAMYVAKRSDERRYHFYTGQQF